MKTPETILREGLANLNLSLEEMERMAALPHCPVCGQGACNHPENPSADQWRFLLYAAIDAAGAVPRDVGINREPQDKENMQ